MHTQSTGISCYSHGIVDRNKSWHTKPTGISHGIVESDKFTVTYQPDWPVPHRCNRKRYIIIVCRLKLGDKRDRITSLKTKCHVREAYIWLHWCVLIFRPQIDVYFTWVCCLGSRMMRQSFTFSIMTADVNDEYLDETIELQKSQVQQQHFKTITLSTFWCHQIVPYPLTVLLRKPLIYSYRLSQLIIASNSFRG